MTDTTYTCPDGHSSSSADYCDTCGAPIEAAATAPPAAAAAPSPAASAALSGATKKCPSCDEDNAESSLFCESCGMDFTTGQLPAPEEPQSSLSLEAPVPVSWVAEVWVDSDWFESNKETASDPCPTAGAPRIVPLVGNGPHLIGRPSTSRGIDPQIDCSPDSGVSRRHAQLLVDRDRWYVEDLGSTNGTYVAAGTASVGDQAIPAGLRRELGETDRIYVGTWTRIVVRRATAAEATA